MADNIEESKKVEPELVDIINKLNPVLNSLGENIIDHNIAIELEERFPGKYIYDDFKFKKPVEIALQRLYHNNTVFNGDKGDFKIKEQYAVHSVRYYIVEKLENNNKN